MKLNVPQFWLDKCFSMLYYLPMECFIVDRWVWFEFLLNVRNSKCFQMLYRIEMRVEVDYLVKLEELFLTLLKALVDLWLVVAVNTDIQDQVVDSQVNKIPFTNLKEDLACRNKLTQAVHPLVKGSMIQVKLHLDFQELNLVHTQTHGINKVLVLILFHLAVNDQKVVHTSQECTNHSEVQVKLS